jgi:hypothetical protein
MTPAPNRRTVQVGGSGHGTLQQYGKISYIVARLIHPATRWDHKT